MKFRFFNLLITVIVAIVLAIGMYLYLKLRIRSDEPFGITALIAPTILLLILLALGWELYRQRKARIAHTEKITHLIRKIGGTDIVVSVARFSRDTFKFMAVYIDASGKSQSRTAVMNQYEMSQPNAEYYWDRPISDNARSNTGIKSEIEREITSMVHDIGGEVASIKPDLNWGSAEGQQRFQVTYHSSSGSYKANNLIVSRPSGKFNIRNYYWDNSTSKEQIISDMAAEIETLKRQLNERDGDSAE